MKRTLTNEFKDLPDGFVVLAVLPEQNYAECNMHLLRLLTQRAEKGAYVSVNRPYNNLISTLKQNKVPHTHIHFVDCVSEHSGHDSHNCTYVGSAQSLTNIGIALDPVIKDKTQSFILLDSLESLTVYNSPANVIRFVRSLITKIRNNKMNGVMLGVHEGMDKGILTELSQVCDKVIDLSE